MSKSLAAGRRGVSRRVKGPPIADSSPDATHFQRHRLLGKDYSSPQTSANKRAAEEIQFMLMGVEEGVSDASQQPGRTDQVRGSRQAVPKSKVVHEKRLLSNIKGQKKQHQVIYQGIVGKELKLFPNKFDIVQQQQNQRFQEKRKMSITEQHRSGLESIKSGTEMRHQSSGVGPTDIDVNQSFGMIDQDEAVAIKNLRGSMLDQFSDRNLQNTSYKQDTSPLLDREQEHRMLSFARDVKKQLRLNARKKQQQQLKQQEQAQGRQTVYSNFHTKQKSHGNFVKQLKDSYNVFNQQQNISYGQQTQSNYNSGINILHAQLPKGTSMQHARPMTGDVRSRPGAASKFNRFNKTHLLNQNSSAFIPDVGDARSNQPFGYEQTKFERNEQPQYPKVLLAQQQGKISHIDSQANTAAGAVTLDASFSKDKSDNIFRQADFGGGRPPPARPRTTQLSVKNHRKDSTGLIQAFQTLKELGSGPSLHQHHSKRAAERGGAAMSKTIEPPLKFDPSTYMNTLRGVQTYEQIQSNILQIKGILEKEKQTKTRPTQSNTLKPEDIARSHSQEIASEMYAATDGTFNIPSFKVSQANSPNFPQRSDYMRTVDPREQTQAWLPSSQDRRLANMEEIPRRLSHPQEQDYIEANAGRGHHKTISEQARAEKQDLELKVENRHLQDHMKSPMSSQHLSLKEQKSAGNQSTSGPSQKPSLNKAALSALLPVKGKQNRRLTVCTNDGQKRESRVKFHGLSQSNKTNSKFKIKTSKTVNMSQKMYSQEKSQSDPSDNFPIDNERDEAASPEPKQIGFAEAYKSSFEANQSFLRKIEEKLLTIQVKQGGRQDSDSDEEATEIEAKLRSHFQQQQEQISIGLETYFDIDSIPQRKELEIYLKTLKTESKINRARAMIQRINAKMKHHILQSEYYSGVDTHGCDMKSKYIDLVPGMAKEVKLLGNVYDDDEQGTKQSKNREPIMKQVPLLFRIMDAKEDESYFFTIKQLNQNQQAEQHTRHCAGSREPAENANASNEEQPKDPGPVLGAARKGGKLDLLRKTAKKIKNENQFSKKMLLVMPKPGIQKPSLADLQVYLSCTCSNPSVHRNDKAVENDIRNNKSRLLQFSFLNKTPEDHLSPKANRMQADNGDKKAQFYKVPCIYVAMQSNMGCSIRILVQTSEGKNEKKETAAFQSKKALIDERYNECDPNEVNAELTEFFDVNANNWDFDAFERHRSRLQSSEFNHKVQKLVIDYKREQRQQNEKQISQRREDLVAMDRLRKIRGINYWKDYKAERNRMIDLAIQLQRTKFLIKRLIALRLASTLPVMVREKMKACRIKHLYRSSQLFVSLKVYLYYKRLQKRHGATFAERSRKRLIRPGLAIAGQAIMENQNRHAAKVLLLFFNGFDQRLKFTEKLHDCFERIKKIQNWIRKPTQKELEESLLKSYGDIMSKKQRRMLPNLWQQRFTRLRYIRRKFEDEQEFVVGHFRRPKNASGSQLAKKFSEISESLSSSVLKYYAILKQKEYLVYYLTFSLGHLEGRLTQLRDTLQKLKSKQQAGRLNLKQRIDEVDEILSNELNESLGSPGNYRLGGPKSPKSLSSASTLQKIEDSVAKKSDEGQRSIGELEQQQVEDFTTFLIHKYQGQINFFEKEVKAKKSKRENEVKKVYQLHQHLYQGLDEFLAAERTVDYSFNRMIERIAQQYHGCDPNSIIDEIHELALKHDPEHEPETKYDETLNYDYQQKKEKKRKLGHGKGGAKHASTKSVGGHGPKSKMSRKSFAEPKVAKPALGQSSVKSPEETQNELSLILHNSEQKLKATNFQLQPFRVHITREEVHKLIFCCCNYDTNSERLTELVLEGNDEELAREILEQEMKTMQTVSSEEQGEADRKHKPRAA